MAKTKRSPKGDAYANDFGQCLFDAVLDAYDDWLSGIPYVEPGTANSVSVHTHDELAENVWPPVEKLCIRLEAYGQGALGARVERAYKDAQDYARIIDDYCLSNKFDFWLWKFGDPASDHVETDNVGVAELLSKADSINEWDLTGGFYGVNRPEWVSAIAAQAVQSEIEKYGHPPTKDYSERAERWALECFWLAVQLCKRDMDDHEARQYLEQHLSKQIVVSETKRPIIHEALGRAFGTHIYRLDPQDASEKGSALPAVVGEAQEVLAPKRVIGGTATRGTTPASAKKKVDAGSAQEGAEREAAATASGEMADKADDAPGSPASLQREGSKTDMGRESDDATRIPRPDIAHAIAAHQTHLQRRALQMQEKTGCTYSQAMGAAGAEISAEIEEAWLRVQQELKEGGPWAKRFNELVDGFFQRQQLPGLRRPEHCQQWLGVAHEHGIWLPNFVKAVDAEIKRMPALPAEGTKMETEAREEAARTMTDAEKYYVTPRGEIDKLLALSRQAMSETRIPGASYADSQRCLVWLTERDAADLGAHAAWLNSPEKERDKAGIRLLAFSEILFGALRRAGVALEIDPGFLLRKDTGLDDVADASWTPGTPDPEGFKAGCKALGRALDSEWERFSAVATPAKTGVQSPATDDPAFFARILCAHSNYSLAYPGLLSGVHVAWSQSQSQSFSSSTRAYLEAQIRLGHSELERVKEEIQRNKAALQAAAGEAEAESLRARIKVLEELIAFNEKRDVGEATTATRDMDASTLPESVRLNLPARRENIPILMDAIRGVAIWRQKFPPPGSTTPGDNALSETIRKVHSLIDELVRMNELPLSKADRARNDVDLLDIRDLDFVVDWLTCVLSPEKANPPPAPQTHPGPTSMAAAGPAEKAVTPTSPKIWTQSWCPSCGRAPIEFISASAFEKNTKKDGKTVGREAAGRRMAKGEYWHNGRKEVPWCEHCRAQTPLGRGSEKPVDAVPKYRPSPIESGQAFAWCAELVAHTFRLPKPDMDLRPSGNAPQTEQDAYEYAAEGVRAILEDAASRGAMPSRDEAEKVARPAIQKYRDKDFKSRKYESRGDMEHPAQEPEANDE